MSATLAPFMASLEPTAVSRSRQPDAIPGYRLDALLGRGGMGEVHKATQLSLNRTVAVKILSSELAKDQSFVARFEKEAAALATLSHPNIVDIVDKGHDGNTWYLVMEYIDGPSLREVMRSPLLEPGAALRMVLEIARGVEYAHSRGVIHRDLKPENILFDEQAGGIAKVTDFGLAGFLDGPNESKFNVTGTHVAMGTASYMAPEQRVDAGKADHRADIYALGVILYELLTGELPMGAFDPPSVRKPGTDPRVDQIVARCLKQDPSERYAKTSDLLADLEPLAPVTKTSFGRGQRASGRIATAVRRAVRAVVRVAAMLLVLAALGVLGISWFRSEQAPSTPFAGDAVTMDLDARDVVMATGRIDKDGYQRKFEVAETGPDSIPLLAYGRPVKLAGQTILSAPAPGQEAGRIVPDVVDLDGDSVTFRSDVSTVADESGLDVFLRRVVFAQPPQSRAILMLTGTPGRYVAVSLPNRGEPLTFEWALGERRGVMLGPPAPRDAQATLSLSVDNDGAVRAFIGKGDDRRQIAEPLILGPTWKKQFGGALKPAMGCVDGTCRFDTVSYEGARRPPPPPPVVVQAPPPAPTPARATVKKASTTSTSKKRTTTSTKKPVRKGGRR